MSTLLSRTRSLVLFLVSLPANALALLLSLPACSRSRFAFRVHKGALWLACPTLSVGGRTLGPNVIQIRDLEWLSLGYPIADHELVHSEQAQGACLLGAFTSVVIAIEGRPLWGVSLPVTLAWLATAGASYAVAWLRGEPTYHGAAIEEAARAGVHQD
jgi:hypothetical protein